MYICIDYCTHTHSFYLSLAFTLGLSSLSTFDYTLSSPPQPSKHSNTCKLVAPQILTGTVTHRTAPFKERFKPEPAALNPKPRANSVCGFKGEVTEALGCEALGCRSKLGDGAAVIVWSVGSLFR